VINDCIAICCRVVMYVYRSSQLRGKRNCPPGSACYNKISCDSSHVVTGVLCSGAVYDVTVVICVITQYASYEDADHSA
jgi:hypothetical protein